MLLVRERAPACHRQPQRVEKPFGDAVHDHVHRRAVITNQSPVERLGRHADDTRDRQAGIVQTRELDARHETVRQASAGDARVEIDQIASVRIRQRTQERGANQAEQGGRRADADRERQDGGSGKRGRCAQLTAGISNVQPQGIHEPDFTYFAVFGVFQQYGIVVCFARRTCCGLADANGLARGCAAGAGAAGGAVDR